MLAGTSFTREALIKDQDVLQSMLLTLATRHVLSTQDGVIYGTQSASGPHWVVYVSKEFPKTNPLGLGLAPCPIAGCVAVPGDGRRFLSQTDWIRQICKLHKKRTLNLVPPREAIVPKYTNLLRWKWPLTTQEYKWVDMGSSGRGEEARMELNF